MMHRVSSDGVEGCVDDEQLRAQLGDAIRRHRKRRGLSQERLGEAAGVTNEWISQIERGVGAPSIDILVRLCRELGVDASEVMREALEEADRGPTLKEIGSLASTLDEDHLSVLLDVARSLVRHTGSRATDRTRGS